MKKLAVENLVGLSLKTVSDCRNNCRVVVCPALLNCILPLLHLPVEDLDLGGPPGQEVPEAGRLLDLLLELRLQLGAQRAVGLHLNA